MRDLKAVDVKIAGCGQKTEQRTVVNERLHWLDNLRGFAIFFVVLGHIALGNLDAGTWGGKTLYCFVSKIQPIPFICH